MVYKAWSLEEAEQKAEDWREDLEGTDWEVVIHEPLFDDDFWLVVTE